MKRITMIAFTAVIVMSLSGMSHGTSRWDNEGITISPQVLVPTFLGTRITVHTNIPAGDVIRDSIYIDIDGAGTLTPCSIYSDNLGFLVVKFYAAEIALFAEPPRAELTLCGDYVEGGEFSASGSVIVR